MRNIKKGSEHFLQERQQKYSFIKQYKKKYPVEKMCAIWNLSRSGYYDWEKRAESKRSVQDRIIRQRIRAVYEENKKRVGSPKITFLLNREGIAVSRPKTARMMKEEGIRCITHRKYKVATTDSNHSEPVAPNRLNRCFRQSAPSRAWVSDLTYIPTAQGWLYLTVVIDLYDRAVIGWSTSDNMTAESTVMKAWAMAKLNRPLRKGMLFHSDRGVQYTAKEFRDELTSNNVRQSMSRKGNCWDNAVAENFFKILKSEMVNHQNYYSHFHAKLEISEFIEIWYNRKRIHSYLGYLTPSDFFKTENKMVA